jgi:hypothetical protein
MQAANIEGERAISGTSPFVNARIPADFGPFTVLSPRR